MGKRWVYWWKLNALKLNPEQVDLMLNAVKLHQERLKKIVIQIQ